MDTSTSVCPFASSIAFEANALFAAGNTAFVFLCIFSSPQVRRSVRSTSAASRRDAERARLKVQVPNLASKAFLSLKRLALKAYLKVRLEIQA